MKITLKDGSVINYEQSKTAYEIAEDISSGLARMACAAEVDGELVDLRTVIDKDCELNILTFNDEGGKEAFHHTSSHVLAEAVKRLYPHAKLAIGPAIENGFYYDFDMEPLDRESLDKIEQEMKKIIKEGSNIERFELPRDEAIKLMEEKGESYKVELINELPEDEVISFYRQGDFVDLCAGPHLMSTKPIKAFKLISSSGAYWRGDENNKMLTRVYGTSFTKKKDLDDYLAHLEEVKKRDHNRLGREMELFTTVDVIGQGLPLLMPKGARIVQLLQRWIEDEEEKRGYLLTKTPFMAKSDLYKISGHWDHYRDGMFIIGDEEDEDGAYALRPMTCPFQYYVYKNSQKSYRDLPVRYNETSTLFRNEDSGEMHGLIRVRQFTLAEGHIICTPEQVEGEIRDCLDLINYIMTTLGIIDKVTFRLSKWDPNNKQKYIGSEDEWERTQSILRNILLEMGLEFLEAEGEAAFYGPKIDIQFKNVHGKEDTIITVQLDNSIAEKFDMYYVDKDGEKKRPYIIHRSSIGCYERTLAMLIEQFAGQFPTWLCPEQVRILPLSEKFHEYGNKVLAKLKENGIRATIDERAEKIGYKIREARLDRIPYQIILGQKEAENNVISLRSRYLGDEGQKDLDTFIDEICKEIRTKAIREIEVQE
ncbi:MAG: threonine--tRNA ligase [Clostridiales bacterium]|nr:threonine--tRNA ligase [Clostridiales bacterium]